MTEFRIIQPPGRWPKLNIRELYQYRDLLWVFVRRGIWSRYRQMALGVMWSFLEPLGLLILMSIVFDYIIRLPTDGYPFVIFMASALVPWTYFNKSTNAAANSVHEQLAIISKIYFPRIILPVSAVIRELFDSIVLFIILVGLAWAFGFSPSLRMLLLPVLLVLITVPALGVGMAVASISVKYRDFRPLLAITMQVVYYATPIFYPASLVPARILPFYQLNPMYWAVECSRWIMLDKPLAITPSFYVSVILVAIAVSLGYFIFAIYERGAVDVQ